MTAVAHLQGIHRKLCQRSTIVHGVSTKGTVVIDTPAQQPIIARQDQRMHTSDRQADRTDCSTVKDSIQSQLFLLRAKQTKSQLASHSGSEDVNI
jgi:hypothetical protein